MHSSSCEIGDFVKTRRCKAVLCDTPIARTTGCVRVRIIKDIGRRLPLLCICRIFVEPFCDHGLGLRGKSIHDVRASSSISRRCRRRHITRVLGGDTECPLQVCQLSRSSESTHFLSLRRDVASFGSIRAPDGF